MSGALIVPVLIAAAAALSALIGLAICTLADARTAHARRRPPRHTPSHRAAARLRLRDLANQDDREYINYLISRESRIR